MLLESIVFLGARYHVLTVDLTEADLTLEAAHHLAEVRDTPGFRAATNGGLYHTVDLPVGWTVAGGEPLAPLTLADGAGNFFLKPNGAFWRDDAGLHVAPSEAVAPVGDVALATQSGPLLLSGGVPHPGFRADSPSRKIRNAVGVKDDHTAVFVLSDDPVNFWELTELFRARLGVADALFLDGTISTMAAPGYTPPESDRGYATLLVVRTPGPSGPSWPPECR